MESVNNIIILGASTRAAAFSALRAGLRPWCADLFGDVDLSQRCSVQVISVDQYPHEFLDTLQQAPRAPWLYTGALENRPRLVRQLARLRPLWGNEATVLAKVRSPRRILEILQAARLPTLAVCLPGDALPRQGRWLLKPLASAGGVGIRFWDGAGWPRKRPSHFYLQEYAEGVPHAAVFVADRDRAHLLGVTRQMVGEDWLGAAPFRYCGSVGPLHMPASIDADLQRLGEVLRTASGLRGLFGIDFLLREGVPWLVEVNPRYTASVEVLEYAMGISALGLHHQVFAEDRDQRVGISGTESTAATIVGKAILFARTELIFPDSGPWQFELESPGPIDHLPAFADIPHPRERIEAGRPILSFFTRAATPTECEDCLRQIAAELEVHR